MNVFFQMDGKEIIFTMLQEFKNFVHIRKKKIKNFVNLKFKKGGDYFKKIECAFGLTFINWDLY